MLRALAIATLLATAARGDVVTMAWDPNPEDDIAGYRLHFGSESGRYPKSFDCGDVTRFSVEIDFDLTLRIGVDRYIVVTAYNTAGLESFLSNEVDLGSPRPRAPRNPRVEPSALSDTFSYDLPAGVWEVHTSTDLSRWRSLGRARDFFTAAMEPSSRRFMRIEPVYP